MSVPNEDFERHVRELIAWGERLGDHGLFHVVAMESGAWPDWSDIELETEQTRSDTPLLHSIQKLHLGPDGQRLPLPTDEGAAKRFTEGNTYRRRLRVALQSDAAVISVLKQQGLWTTSGLHAAIVRSPLFRGAEVAVGIGLEAFGANRHWEAVHALIPQVERALRRLAQLLAVDVYAYETKSGRIRSASLEGVLSASPLRRVLNEIRPSLALELELLLIDAAGLNLRNNIAHGVLRPDTNVYNHSLICVLILLLLGMLRPDDGLGTTLSKTYAD